MSSNSIKIVFFITFFIFIFDGCLDNSNISKPNYHDGSNDTLILMALDGEYKNNKEQSFYYYSKLYKKTDGIKYLKKTITYSFESKKFQAMQKLSLDGIKKFPKQKEYFKTQYIISLLAQNKPSKALQEAKKLLKLNPNSKNYLIIANIYYAMQNYKEALRYYESAYAQSKTAKTLNSLTDILYTYLNKKSQALAYLETYLQTQGCSDDIICRKLMLIYQEQGNIDGMITVLSKMYSKYSKNDELKIMSNGIQNLIISLLEKKDIKKAIKYLEKTKSDDVKLMNLYYQDSQIKKALQLTKKLYKKTSNPELLGKIAIFRFELAKDKKKVLKHVIANFELTLSSGLNIPEYQNYYGYLLIDYDLDIKKGVNLVKEALKTQPNNIAYIDSLAWGYYKLGECEKAYNLMNKVIKITGLVDKDIKEHWDKINSCKRIIKNDIR